MATRAGDPEADPDFWSIRNSMFPVTPEMDRVADLLEVAANLILVDRGEEAIALIHEADITVLFDERGEACLKPPVFSVHRQRSVPNLPPKIPTEQQAPKFKSESPLGEMVFRRDGWRCRYCGCRVVPAKVRKWMQHRLGGAIRWTKKDAECHAGFWALWGTIDHVVPRARGGRNEAENLVTACHTCNFAKIDFTLEQLGLADPHGRPPVLDGWDGLTGLLTKAVSSTPAVSAEPPIPPIRTGHMGMGAGVAVTKPGNTRLTKSPPSPEEYYAKMQTLRPGLAAPLRAFLADLEALGVDVEFERSVVLRFSIGAGKSVSPGYIETNGRMTCLNAEYWADQHGHREIGQRYLAAIAALGDGELRISRGGYQEVFGRNGGQINIAALLSDAESWKQAVADFVRDMRAAARK